MATPNTILRKVLMQATKTVMLFCTDGGANDGNGVEWTGTSDGAANVNLAGGSGLSGLATAAKQDTGNTSLATIAAAQPFLKPPGSHTAITPSDATDITAIASIGLLCTVAGSLSVRGATTTGTTVTYDVVAGQYIWGAFSRVMAATTATVMGLAP